MRVTPSITADNALYNLQQGRTKLDKIQEQIATGSIVNRPSDDPLTTRQLLDLQNLVLQGDQHAGNISQGSLSLNLTSTALDGMTSLLTNAKKIASDIASGSSDPNITSNAVTNLTQIKAQLIDLGNTRIGNKYIFGGFKSSAAPFDATGTFSGTDDAINIEINTGSNVPVNLSGGTLLRGGTPPATVGSGVSAGARPIDILGSIDSLIAAINGNNTSGIKDGISNLKAATDQVADAQSDVAGRLVRLDNAKNMIDSNQNMLKGIMSDKQSVDYAKAATELSQQTTAFNAALSATAKISQLSLLDYLK